MNVGILGAGSIGKRHLGNCVALKEELGIGEIRVFDTREDRRTEVKEQFPGVVTTDSVSGAIQGTDAVFVCVPTSLHIPILQQILEENPAHVYLEKPFSHTLDGCDQTVFDYARAGKALVVGYMLPNHPVLRRVKEMLDGEELGRVLSVRAESGFFLPQWHPWEDYRDYYMSWKTGGGGALLDTSHEINYLQWLFGDIAEVKGYMGTISDLEITSDDMVTALLQFESGAFGQLQLDLLQFDEARFCKVIGTEAVMIADLPTNTIRVNRPGETEWTVEEVEVDFDQIYHHQLREFFKACAGEPAELIFGDAAVKTMEVVEAVRRSHAVGTGVKLPLFS